MFSFLFLCLPTHAKITVLSARLNNAIASAGASKVTADHYRLRFDSLRRSPDNTDERRRRWHLFNHIEGEFLFKLTKWKNNREMKAKFWSVR